MGHPCNKARPFWEIFLKNGPAPRGICDAHYFLEELFVPGLPQTLTVWLVLFLGVALSMGWAGEGEDSETRAEKTARMLNSRKILVRVTYYGPDAKWGNQIASTTKRRAEQGRTAAVDPSLIPYGSVIHLPGIGQLVAEDTGTDVIARKASESHGNIPVIDVYVEEPAEAEKLSREMPETMMVTITTENEVGVPDILPKKRKSPPPAPRLEIVRPQPDMA